MHRHTGELFVSYSLITCWSGAICDQTTEGMMDDIGPRVLEKFHQLFGAHPNSEQLLQLLAQYGSRDGDRERDRVRLAILKLSDGDPVKLRNNVAAAMLDYRDVLAWAEYPEQMRTGKSAFNSSRDEIEEITKRDSEQYRAWLEEDSHESDHDSPAWNS